MMIIAFVGVALLGVSTWWALEYVLHRFVGHKPRGRTLFSREHRRHHAEGDYFAPTWRKALGVAPPMLAAFGLLSLGIGWALSATYCLGLLAMYVGYEVFHRRLHTHPPRSRYGRWARRHHFHHHFVNPKANHGVTTHFGDIVMGTLDAAVQIPVPERLAMTWLLDETSGEIVQPYRQQYRLVPLKR